MSPPSAHGIKRQGVDTVFAAEEARKSHLLLTAQLLRAQHQFGAAAEMFAEAAAIEEQLQEMCFTQGLREKALLHGFSAASCWAQAGNFHHAILLCQRLLTYADVPERLRERIDAYAKMLDARRAQWYEELIEHDTGYEGA
jgi:hypothetical protein